MRWTRALTLPVLAVMVIACGGPGTDGGDGGNGGNGSEESQAGAPDPDEGNGGNGGNGGDPGDLEELANDLEPPNATESTRMTASGALIVGWTSSDSIDSLESFYDNKINELGLNLVGKSSAGGAHSWIIGDEDGSGPQGAITIGDDGSGGSTVSLTLGFQS